MKRIEVFLGIGWATVIWGLLTVAAATWWMLYPYKGLAFREPELPISPVTFVRGTDKYVRYTLSYCVDRGLNLPLEIQRELSIESGDSVLPIAPPMEYFVRERCETRNMLLAVPEGVDPGLYRIVVHTKLQVNPIRAVFQSVKTQPFTIR